MLEHPKALADSPRRRARPRPAQPRRRGGEQRRLPARSTTATRRPRARHRARAEHRAGGAKSAGSRRSPSSSTRRWRAELVDDGKRADVFHANNVLAHVADLNGFVEGISIVLADDGVAVIEAPYVRDMIDNCEFDTIYHEHLCYFSLTALEALFRRHGLAVADVERIPDARRLAPRLRPTRAKTGHRPRRSSTCSARRPRGASPTLLRTDAFALRVTELGEELRALLAGLRGTAPGSPPTAPRRRGARSSTSSGSARRRSTSSSTAAPSSGSLHAGCPPAHRSAGAAPRRDARLPAAARLEPRGRDHGAAGRVPAARRPLHRSRSRPEGGVR